MGDPAAGGVDINGDTMARRGGEEEPMTVARAIAGMVGGAGEFSYTRNSLLQSQSINILEPILEQEIKELELFKDWSGSAIRVADFGCSVGANTLGYADVCYRNVCRARLSSNGRKIPDDVQYFFCDLPSNDFNTLFLQLEDWRKTQTSMEDFYATAVAGSFYRPLLPRGSLHVAISVYALHWMSQGMIEEERRDSFNVPTYYHSVDDVKVVAESTNAFHIKRCEIKQQSFFPPNEVEHILGDFDAYGWFAKNFNQSHFNSIMVEHIGEEKCHKFFERFEKNAATTAREKRMSNLPMDCILAVLIRKLVFV